MANRKIAELQIEHERNGSNGRFVINLGDGIEAQMTYVQTKMDVVSINHTGVPPEFRGKDIAARLVDFGVHALAAEGKKILPTCWYVAAQFKRHKDWAQFLA